MLNILIFHIVIYVLLGIPITVYYHFRLVQILRENYSDSWIAAVRDSSELTVTQVVHDILMWPLSFRAMPYWEKRFEEYRVLLIEYKNK